jgi:hypothetical protein
MPSESQLRELLEQFLDQVLEPRVRSLIESGEIETQADFDDALLPAAALRGTIDEWESDLKAALGYEAMPSAPQETVSGFSSPEEREAWLAEVCSQLEVTREQLASMDLDAIFRKIREL